MAPESRKIVPEATVAASRKRDHRKKFGLRAFAKGEQRQGSAIGPMHGPSASESGQSEQHFGQALWIDMRTAGLGDQLLRDDLKAHRLQSF